MTDDTQPEALRALAEAATWTGKWYDAGRNTVHCTYDKEDSILHDEIAHPVPFGVSGYIAAAHPQAVIALLDRIAELESELEAVGAGGVSGPLMGIAAPPTAQAEGWISVDEELPPVRVTVFVVRGTGPSAWRTMAFYDPDRYQPAWRCNDDPSEGIRGVSHWMHMPPPPTSAEGVEHG